MNHCRSYRIRLLVEDFRGRDRKSTRLNSSHSQISYAVFCLKKNSDEQFRLTVHARIEGSSSRVCFTLGVKPRHLGLNSTPTSANLVGQIPVAVAIGKPGHPS